MFCLIIKDAVDGIGIDWDGSDTEINPEFYECDNLNQDFSSLPSIFEVECETPPEVKYFKIFFDT